MLRNKAGLIEAPSRIPRAKEFHEQGNVGRTSKFENNIIIKPSSGADKQKDYKFETDEEIQTEEECRKFQTNSNSHRRSSLASLIAEDHTQLSVALQPRKSKMGFFCCDSLSIRPSTSLSEPEDRNQFSSISIKDNRYCSSNGPKSKSNYDQVDGRSAGDYSSVKPVQCRMLRPSGYKHRKIFQEKEKIEKKLAQIEQNLPRALRSDVLAKIQKECEDEFHITFETDQITNCCF